MTEVGTPLRARHARAGFSLLEVLVASGLLVLGLAGFAALLPAAGSRLAEATAEDRAGTLASNAFAEIASRGLAASDLFPSGSTNRACVFGPVLTGLAHPAIVAAASATLAPRIEPTRGFSLEDDLNYRIAGSTDTPVNAFVNGGLGPRESKEGHCWAAMLTPLDFGSPIGPGSRAMLSVVVFRKAGDMQTFTLTPASGNYELSPGDDSSRKRFARGCSYLLVLPTGAAPTWRRINASWTSNPGAAGQRSFLNFSDPTGLPPGNLTAIGCERLLRVDERTIVLD
jgi:type II secretory pathway pseudopilin PulG